jgi:hypothetical protein
VAADLDLRDVIGEHPYRLRDSAGRRALLDDLSSMLLTLEGPVQAWHGPEPLHPAPGDGEAAELHRQLQASAGGRQTRLIGAGNESEIPRLATASGEGSRHLDLSDSTVARVFALSTWPPAATPGWLGEIAAASEAVAVHLRPVPQDVAVRLLRRRLTSLSSSAAVDEQAGRLSDPDLDLAAQAATNLRHAVARGTTQLVHVQVLVALIADTLPELDELTAHAHRLAHGVSASLCVLAYEQGPAWAATQPAGRPVRWPWRLLDGASAAAALPLPVGPRSDATGTLAGVDPESGVPIRLDRFTAHNPSRLVVGTSGAGKSYAAKLELTRQLASGARAIVVDPEGEFGRIADVLGGLCLAVGEEPAGLDPIGLACRTTLSPAEGLSVLSTWAAALLGGPLTSIDLALVDRALAVLRADRAAQPSPADLLAVISDLCGHPPFTGADLPARLAPAAGSALGELFAPNPDLAQAPDLVVFDLRAVPDRARPAVMACVLSWAWSETVAAGVQRPRLVVVDEAHLLLDDEAAAQVLVQFARRARKYGVGLEIVTQRLSDFLRHPAGEAVLANTATKLLLGCEDRERAAVAAGLGLTAAEADLLRPGTRGTGLLLGPSLRTPIHVVAGPSEHVLAAGGPR